MSDSRLNSSYYVSAVRVIDIDTFVSITRKIQFKNLKWDGDSGEKKNGQKEMLNT